MTYNPDTEWDIEQYRHFWESDEHWMIRRDFMIAHKSRFPEDKLVCLAQVFANIELLGCRYPAEVMKQVAHLAKDLEKPKKRNSQVAFVKESSNTSKNSRGQDDSTLDFARPVKRQRLPSLMPEEEAEKKLQSSDLKTGLDKNQLSDPERKSANSFVMENYARKLKKEQRTDIQNSLVNRIPFNTGVPGGSFALNANSFNNPTNLFNRTPSFIAGGRPSKANINNQNSKNKLEASHREILRKFYDLQKQIIKGKDSGMNVVQLLETLTSKCHLKCKRLYIPVPGRQSQNSLFECIVHIEEVRVASAFGTNKKLACKNAYNAALSSLEKQYFAIIMDDSKKLTLSSNGKFISGSSTGFQSPNVYENYDDSDCDFVIIESVENSNNPIGTLHSSAGFSGATVQFENTNKSCTVIINGQTIATASGENNQQAKREAAETALSILKQRHFTVKIKKKFISDGDVARGDIPDTKKQEEAISDDNVGNKLLRLMGWTGGGLGKDGLGISEPVKVNKIQGRKGLGSQQGEGEKATKEFKAYIESTIREYACSNTHTDLTFSPEFTNEERKVIHQIANKYKLKSVSRGKGDERFLIISRKMNPKQLLQHLMQFGGSTDKYELIPPCHSSKD